MGVTDSVAKGRLPQRELGYSITDVPAVGCHGLARTREIWSENPTVCYWDFLGTLARFNTGVVNVRRYDHFLRIRLLAVA